MTTHESKKKGNSTKLTVILMLLVLAIVIVPQVIKSGAEFGGSDDEASNAISSILEVDEYKPWFSPIYEPPGGETESLLFCLQAAIGAGIFGFGLGTLMERGRNRKEKSK